MQRRRGSSSNSAGNDRPQRNFSIHGVVAAVCILLICCTSAPAFCATLDLGIQKKIQAATFEVVIPKPLDDPLTYEKPLPLELLPYQFRNDKYFSVGTAFALGGGRYATAGHVLALSVGGLWTAPALRDASGNVYPIAQMVKYSEHEDFAVFTLTQQPAHAVALEIDTKPQLNDTVYSVGNALGTGVVIRDGLYTSDTPEDQDGRWKWLRFSAAASPGNSGGPLLDKNGKIIGVVLMKSPNENLNYAVSIDQVLKAPDNVARIDTREQYRLDIFDKVETSLFKQEFALPKSFDDFAATLAKVRNEFTDQSLHDLLSKNADSIFPRGSGTHQLLHRVYSERFPALVVRGNNDVWQLDAPKPGKVELEHNGYVSHAQEKSQVMIHLRRPDDVPAAKLYTDATLFGDLVLKAIPLYRHVGSEPVKITSLGKPQEDSSIVDKWGRKWQLRVWPIAYENAALVTLATPVPDGYVAMQRIAFGPLIHRYVAELKTLADFVDVAYAGGFAQWQEFLQEKSVLPVGFSNLDIRFDYGRSFDYRSKRVAFSYTPDLQKIDKDSELKLEFAFIKEGDNVVLDVAGIAALANATSSGEIGVYRHAAPADDLDDSDKATWSKRVHRQHPYDAVAFDDGDLKLIRSVYGKPDTSAAPTVLYTLLYKAEGQPTQKAMKAKLDLLAQKTRVDEH